MNRPDTVRWRASLVLRAASGFAGLGYQIVWTQQCALWLGHESAAVLAVVAAFFGGLAAGASLLGPAIERSTRPARWYAACESAIAGWSVVLLMLMAPFGDWVLGITGAQPAPVWQWTVAFCATFIVLLPATAAMGATLPAIERAFADRHGDNRSTWRPCAASSGRSWSHTRAAGPCSPATAWRLRCWASSDGSTAGVSMSMPCASVWPTQQRR